MIEQKNIAAWSPENKAAPLQAILDHAQFAGAVDVCVVGSLCYSDTFDDIDAICFFDGDFPERESNSYHEYDGMRLVIGYMNIENKHDKVSGNYDMPKYSLTTGTMYNGDAGDIAAYRARFKQ